MKFVHVEHPKTGGKALVPESALPTHKKAGWRVVREPKEASREKPSEPKEPRAAVSAPEQEKTARKRSESEESSA